MSYTLQFIQRIIFNGAAGETLYLGDISTPKEVSITNGLKYDVTAIVEDDYGSEVLWAQDGGTDTYEAALVYSDADVFLEFLTDADEYVLMKIQGGIWHLLTHDDMAGHDTASRIDGSALVDGTDYDAVVQITALRDEADGQGDATIRLILLS